MTCYFSLHSSSSPAAPPTFVFSNDSVLFEERITLLGSDVFINCSVNYGTEYNITSWLFDNEPLPINQTSRFNQNTSGLTIYNVTKLDGGNYTCYVDQQLLTVILMHTECKNFKVAKLLYMHMWLGQAKAVLSPQNTLICIMLTIACFVCAVEIL